MPSIDLTAQASAIEGSAVHVRTQAPLLPRSTHRLDDQPGSPESGGKPAVKRPASHQRRSDANG